MQACRSELHATSRLARYSRPCTVQAGGGSAASGTWRRLSCAGAPPVTYYTAREVRAVLLPVPGFS
jgi:hypothetical protein